MANQVNKRLVGRQAGIVGTGIQMGVGRRKTQPTSIMKVGTVGRNGEERVG